jgi:hypothetical protein
MNEVSFTGISRIDRLLSFEEETKNQLGNATRGTFLGEADRYLFDFNLNLNEWDQFDTDSDAWYFGTWVNKERLYILQYVEGDVTYTQCEDAESFDKEIAALCSFHGQSPSFVCFDLEAKTETHHYQDRSKFFIDPDRAAEALRQTKETHEGGNGNAA